MEREQTVKSGAYDTIVKEQLQLDLEPKPSESHSLFQQDLIFLHFIYLIRLEIIFSSLIF